MVIRDSLLGCVVDLIQLYNRYEILSLTSKLECIDNGKTIIFTHHISQKSELTLDYLMTGTTATVAMGNSAQLSRQHTYHQCARRETDLQITVHRPVAQREPYR
jgi:ABC-type multidrug transport system ATPase subunit